MHGCRSANVHVKYHREIENAFNFAMTKRCSVKDDFECVSPSLVIRIEQRISMENLEKSETNNFFLLCFGQAE